MVNIMTCAGKPVALSNPADITQSCIEVCTPTGAALDANPDPTCMTNCPTEMTSKSTFTFGGCTLSDDGTSGTPAKKLSDYKAEIEAARNKGDNDAVNDALNALTSDKDALKKADPTEVKDLADYLKDYKAPKAVKDNKEAALKTLGEDSSSSSAKKTGVIKKADAVEKTSEDDEDDDDSGRKWFFGGSLGFMMMTMPTWTINTPDLYDQAPPYVPWHINDKNGWGWGVGGSIMVDFYRKFSDKISLKLSPGADFYFSGYKVYSEDGEGGPDISITGGHALFEIGPDIQLSKKFSLGIFAKLGVGGVTTNFNDESDEDGKCDPSTYQTAAATCYNNLGIADTYSNFEGNLDGEENGGATAFDVIYQLGVSAKFLIGAGLGIEFKSYIGGQSILFSNDDTEITVDGAKYWYDANHTDFVWTNTLGVFGKW